MHRRDGGPRPASASNIGTVDRLVRTAAGLAMLGFGIAGGGGGGLGRRRRRGPRVGWILGGAFLAAEGIAGYCPFNAALGISTREDAPRGASAERLRALARAAGAALRRGGVAVGTAIVRAAGGDAPAGGDAQGQGEAAPAVTAARRPAAQAADAAEEPLAERAASAVERGAAAVKAGAIRAGSRIVARGLRGLGDAAASGVEARARAGRGGRPRRER